MLFSALNAAQRRARLRLPLRRPRGHRLARRRRDGRPADAATPRCRSWACCPAAPTCLGDGHRQHARTAAARRPSPTPRSPRASSSRCCGASATRPPTRDSPTPSASPSTTCAPSTWPARTSRCACCASTTTSSRRSRSSRTARRRCSSSRSSSAAPRRCSPSTAPARSTSSARTANTSRRRTTWWTPGSCSSRASTASRARWGSTPTSIFDVADDDARRSRSPEGLDLQRYIQIALRSRLELMTARDEVEDWERRVRIREQDLLSDLDLTHRGQPQQLERRPQAVGPRLQRRLVPAGHRAGDPAPTACANATPCAARAPTWPAPAAIWPSSRTT